jgi:uncharacterized membrane protein
MNAYLAVGLTALAGAALVETALIPGLVIGGAAVLGPAMLRNMRPRSVRRTRKANWSSKPAPAITLNHGTLQPLMRSARSLGVKQAILKTITFRIVVTTLDFSANYFVIGNVGTAAGLSAISLAAGPVFYFVHETLWNYYQPTASEIGFGLPLRRRSVEDTADPSAFRTLIVSRAVAKTITFRTIATIMDFTINFIVVRDVATAAGLSAFGFFLGPFVYLGHEKAWEYFSTGTIDSLAPPAALAAPRAG